MTFRDLARLAGAGDEARGSVTRGGKTDLL